MRILTLAGADIRLTLRDRSSMFWIFAAPFLWVYFFSFLMRPSDPAAARVSLAVLQQDASPLAERFIENLRAENFGVTVIRPGEKPGQEEEAPARVLTIPAGFGNAILQRRKITLDLKEQGSANPEGTFAVKVALHKATVRLLAGEALGGLDPEDDAVRVRASWAADTVPTGYYQTIPGNLVMFVLMSTMTYGAALLSRERADGLLRRLASSPVGRTEIITGKLLGRAGVATVQVAVFILSGLTLFKIEWGRSPAGLLALLSTYILCAAAFGLLLGTLFASPDASSGVGITAVMVMAAAGGCWWPAEVMPHWLRTAAYALPTGWAMNGLHQLLSWGGGLQDVLPHCAVLALFALGAATLAVRRLKA